MVQGGELFFKELGEGKQFRSKEDTGRHRGKLQKRKTGPLKLTLKLLFSQHLPLIHCQVTHIIPRDTLANGFCGESLTYDWSHDCLCRCPGCAGCSKLTNVWHILECTQDKCWPLSYPSTSYPDSPKVRQARSDVTYKKKWEIFGLCILPQCPLNYSLVKTALVLVGPDSTKSREQIFSKHLFCDLATFYWKCQPEWGLEFPWEQTGLQVDSKSSFLVFFPLFCGEK